jgi:hypothetical protein
MQRLFLVLPLSAILVVTATGCRQTTGSMAGGPAATGTLSPVNPGQSPILGPFGGNTRVTPPPTGSYQPNGGYIGASTAPQATPGTAFSSSGSQIAPSGNNAAIGSGVQAVGWTETNAVIPNGTPPERLSTYGTNPSASDPRSGGMQVIDLTGAPAPPGYQPQYQPTPVAQLPPRNAVGAPIGNSTNPLAPNSVVTFPQTDWQPQGTTTPIAQNTPSPVAAPIQDLAPNNATIPAATTTIPPASTEPVNQNNGSSDLTWRRPGNQF